MKILNTLSLYLFAAIVIPIWLFIAIIGITMCLIGKAGLILLDIISIGD